jgi:cyclopropane-fatty-acyl-phospholipid synthase
VAAAGQLGPRRRQQRAQPLRRACGGLSPVPGQGLNYSFVSSVTRKGDTLEAPQQARPHRTATKLCPQPDVTAVGIGSGLGSFTVHIAKTTGAKVVAINVSPEQIKVSRTLAEREGVAGPVEFREMDYRALQGRFDRVVSVGTMEHVGIGYFGAHIQKHGSC